MSKWQTRSQRRASQDRHRLACTRQYLSQLETMLLVAEQLLTTIAPALGRLLARELPPEAVDQLQAQLQAQVEARLKTLEAANL